MEQSAVQSASEAAAQRHKLFRGVLMHQLLKAAQKNTAAAAESSTGTAESSAESAADLRQLRRSICRRNLQRYRDRTARNHGSFGTVSGGVITSVEIVSYEDDSQYFERARETINPRYWSHRVLMSRQCQELHSHRTEFSRRWRMHWGLILQIRILPCRADTETEVKLRYAFYHVETWRAL